jgi:uncharacterized tellurite resistance protein B-like protein
MIKALKNLFSGNQSSDANADAPSAELATAALMVEAAMTDGVYADVEHDRIMEILTGSFELSQADAEAMLSQAEDLAEQAVDHHRFTKIVKALPHDQRMVMMTHLWSVALADGERDAHEDALLRRLAPLLALSDRDRAEARQAAESRASKR